MPSRTTSNADQDLERRAGSPESRAGTSERRAGTPEPHGGRGRPGLVLAVWAGSLLALAALAPMVQEALGVPFELLSLVMLAPALACAVVLARPAWLPRPWRRVEGRSVLLVALLAAAAVAAFVVVLSVATGRRPTLPVAPAGAPIATFLGLQAVGVLAEEVGWRGVVQRCGEAFARPAVVSGIAGFLFGATHLGYWSLGVMPVLTFALTAMCMSLTITTLFTGSFWQRMVPAVIVHLGLNLGLTAVAASDEAMATRPVTLAAAVVMLLVAVAVAGRAVVARLAGVRAG